MAPERLRDEIEIQRLAAAYSHAVMRLDAVAAAAVYAEDGMLTAFHKDSIVGRVAIGHALERTFAPLAFLAQTCGAGIIVVEDDRASATWTVSEFLRVKDEDAISCCIGSYDDTLVRTAQGWRFAHRRFLPFYRGPLSGGRSYPHPEWARGLGNWPPAPLT